MKTTTFIFLCLLGSLLAYGQQKNTSHDPVCIQKEICLRVPVPYKEAPELMHSLRQVNDKIIYVAGLQVPGSAKSFLFSVSKYISPDAMSIDSAFAQTTQFSPVQGDGYQLVDYGCYTKEGKTLRYKISIIRFDSGVEVLNVMYYLMPSEVSGVLYELKCSCPPTEQARCKTLMEKIALSVSFSK